jgi:hypothetical protein
MTIGQQPTDLTNTDRKTGRASVTPAAGTRPEGGSSKPPGATAPPSIALAGAYHGEGRAIEKRMRKGKTWIQTSIGAATERGTVHRPRHAPSKGAPLQWPDFKSPSERASDAAGPGATEKGPPGGSGHTDSHHATGEGLDETATDAAGPGATQRGPPNGSGHANPDESQHPTGDPPGGRGTW